MLISHITPEQVGKEITLSGWVVHARASGKICFVELRDGSGFIQCVAQKNPSALVGTSKPPTPTGSPPPMPSAGKLVRKDQDI